MGLRWIWQGAKAPSTVTLGEKILPPSSANFSRGTATECGRGTFDWAWSWCLPCLIVAQLHCPKTLELVRWTIRACYRCRKLELDIFQYKNVIVIMTVQSTRMGSLGWPAHSGDSKAYSAGAAGSVLWVSFPWRFDRPTVAMLLVQISNQTEPSVGKFWKYLTWLWEPTVCYVMFMYLHQWGLRSF